MKLPSLLASTIILICASFSSGVADNIEAPPPAVQIINLSKPGALEIRVSEPVELESALNLERRLEDGSFKQVLDLDLGTMKLVTACGQKIGKTVLVGLNGMRPMPWTGMSCSSQCWGNCDKNVYLQGQFRFFVVRASDKHRFYGPVFEMPAER